MENCKNLATVKMELGDANTLDFSTGAHVPKDWERLRNEAVNRFRDIRVYQADIKAVINFQIPDTREAISKTSDK